MAFNRELSQFANYLELDAGAKYISIAADSNAEVGIGTAATEAKLTVGGDVFVTGVVTATNFIGSFTGNADTASALQTSRTIALGGDLSGSVSFDGASDVTIVGTVNPNSVDLGTDTVGNYVATLGDAGLGNLVVSGSGSETASVTLDLSDTGVGANTYGATGQLPVITVDAKGRITSATTTDVATSLSVEGDSGSASVDLLAEKMDFDGGSNITSSVATIPSQIYPVLSSTNNDADLSSPLTFQKVSGSGSGFINAISTIQTETTGKYYAEFTLDNFSSFGFIGIGVRNNLASGNISKGRDYSQIGRWEDEYGLYPNSYTDIRFYHNGDHPTSNVGDNQAGFEAVQVGDVIGLLLDLDNSTLSFSKNGVVGNNISIASGLNYQIGVSVFRESQTVTVNFGESAFLYLPEGYTGLSGESPDGGGASVTFALDPDISLTSVTASGTLSADGVVSGSEFHTGAEGSSIRVTSNTISGPATITLDPAGVGDNTGKVIIAGDLQVDGTQTIVNSTTVAIDDLNIQVASEAADDGEANGAGFTVNSGEGNKTFQFEAIGDNFGSSENLNLASDKTFKIENIDVLSSDTLGAGVTNSSLTSVGVLENLTVTGVVTSVAGFDGSFLGNLDGEARIAQAFSTARNFSASGDATAPQVLFDGTDDVDLNLTLANTGVVAGTYGTTIQIPKIVVDSKGRITSITEVTGDLLEKAGGVMSGILEVGQIDNPPVEVLVHENGERIGDFNSAAATVTETTGSVYFDGTGDYLDVGSSSDYQFGTGDFTVEMIVYANDFVRRGTFFDGRNSADSIGLTIGHDASTGEIKVYMNATSGSDIVVQSSNFATQTWTHIAVTRESGTVRLFIDGVLEDSATRTSDLNSVTINRLGYKTHTISSYDYFYGYMSNARIVKGTAVYTEDFTVPTEQLTAIAGTVLLCCQSTTDAAAEETGKTITVNGDAVASTETPGLTYERNPFGSFNGLTGSVAFDGSGDFLSIPNSSDFQFGSGDFTIEGWFYLNSLGRDHSIVNKWDSGNSEWNVKINGENQLILRINIGGGSIDIKDSESVSASTWYHFAIVRDGNTFKIFKNGQLREDKNLSVTIPSVNADVKIGQILNLDYFDGYISNLRLVKGNAVYTEDFTVPTTQLTPYEGGGTALLCCQSTTDAAAEETGKTITVNGDAVASTTSPGLTTTYIVDGADGNVWIEVEGSVADSTPGYLKVSKSSDSPDAIATYYTFDTITGEEYNVTIDIDPRVGTHIVKTLFMDGEGVDVSKSLSEVQWTEGEGRLVKTYAFTANSGKTTIAFGDGTQNNTEFHVHDISVLHTETSAGAQLKPTGEASFTATVTAPAFVGNLTGNVVGNVTGNLTGNADTATRLQTARTIAVAGAVAGNASFDGTGNITLNTTQQANTVELATHTTGDYVETFSGTAGNISVTGASGERSTPSIDLVDHGPGAATYGTSSAYPIITLDEKGRVTNVTTDNTIYNSLNTERQARIDNDALKLDLAGGTMSGNLEVGQISSAPVEALVHTTNGPISRIGDRIGDFNYGDDANIWTKNGSGADAYATVGGDLVVTKTSNSSYGIGAWYAFDTIAGTEYTAVVDLDPKQNTNTVTTYFFDGSGVNFPQIALETWSEGDGRQTKTFTFTAESARTTIAFGDATQFTRSFSVYDVSVTYAPSTAGVLIGTDGTAAFSGNLTATTAPVAAAHLTNKQYVDGLNADRVADITANLEAIAAEEAARISADTTLQTNITAEQTARIANDALKLDLAGGTMTGAINLGLLTSDTLEFTAPSPSTDTNADCVIFDFGEGAYDNRLQVIAHDDPYVQLIVYASIDGTSWSTANSGANDSYVKLGSRYMKVLPKLGGSVTIKLYELENSNQPVPYTIHAHREALPGDSDVVGTGTLQMGGSAASVLGVDGTATFGGLVSAATAPIADEHLTNKLYVDQKAAVNAAAIEAVVGGAPELLNTLNELSDAISDDENFSATVAGNIAAERTARIDADTVLQSNIDSEAATRLGADGVLQTNITAEETARIANDALKLDLAGGTMTGAIELGSVSGPPSFVPVDNNITVDGSTITFGNIPNWHTAILDRAAVPNSFTGKYYYELSVTDPGRFGNLNIGVNEQGELTAGRSASAVFLRTDSGQLFLHGEATIADGFESNYAAVGNVIGVLVDGDNDTVSFTVNGALVTKDGESAFHLNGTTGNPNKENNIFITAFDSITVEVNMAPSSFPAGYQAWPNVENSDASASVLGVDGTATFGGLVSAATAPVAAAHLTNKEYVDGLNAARVASTNLLTANLATEVEARKANDDLKLDLAGGTMSGDINMGNSPTSWSISSVVKYTNGGNGGNITDIFDGGTNNGWYAAGSTTDNGQGVTFDPLTIESGDTLEVWMDNNGNNSAEIRINQTIATGDAGNRSGYTDITQYIPSFPFELTGLGWYGGSNFTNSWIKAVRINGVIVTDGFITGGSPAATLGVDGTATFGGAISAAGGTMSGDLDMGSNKITYSNVYSTEADLPSASNYHGMFAHVHATGSGYYAHAGEWIKLETAADSAAADALKLDLAGGTMSGAINLGANFGGNGFEYSSLSAASFQSVNTFDATVSISDHASGIEIQKGSRDGWVARLPFNPTIGEANTVSYQIVGDGDVTAVVKANVVRVPSGADGSGSTFTNQYAIPGHLDLMGGNDYGEESLKISGLAQQSGTFTFTPTDATGDYFIYFKLTGDDKFYIGDLSVTPLGAASAASVLGVDGTATFGGLVSAPTAAISDNLELSGTITDSASSTGELGYVLKSTGDSVEWIDILSILPQTRTTQSFTATTSQTDFQFEYNVNYLDVFVNGVRLTATEYIATDGFDITIKEPLFAGDKVEFVSYAVQGSGTGTVSSSNDLTDITLSGPENNDILVYDGAQFVNQQTLSLSGSIQAAAFSGDGANLTSLNASNLATGTITAARLGVSGTRDNTTFLRGDNTWAVVDSTTLLDTNGAVRVASTVTGADVTGNLNVSGAMSGEITPVDGSANGWHRVAFVNATGTSDVLKDGSFSYNPSAKRLSVGGVVSGDKVTSYYDINVSSGGVNAAGIVTCTGLDVTGNSTITGNIVPTADNTYDLGSPTASWKDVYIGPGSLYVNGQKVIEENSQNIVVSADENQNLVLETTGSGDIELNPVGTGVVQVKGTLLVQDGTNIMNSNGNDVVFSSNVAVDNLVSRTEGSDLTLSGRGSGGVRVSDSLLVNGAIEAASMEINTGDLTVEGGVEATTLNAGGTGGIIISNNTIVGPSSITIDPATVGDATGDVYILGNLQVEGTTTTVNSVELAIADKNITVAKDADSAAAADGAGMTVAGANATFNYSASADSWVANKDVKSEGTVTATNFNTTSDVNLKENIRPVEGASELVSNLEGVHYTWKSNGEETLGVIAQQIEEHLPQLVQTSGTYKTVNYNGLIGVLIEAVKEQGSQINALKAEIEELKK